MVIASVNAKPSVLAPLAYSAAPLVAPAALPYVTATSSQFVSRNFNGVAVAAPLIAAAPAPLAYSSPIIASPYATPYASPYAAAPYFI